MFERYTEKARRVIFFSRYEASEFGSPYIETEHLLLGLLREDKNLVHRVLMKQPSAIDEIRNKIESATIRREKTSTSVDLPLSNESKRILAHAAEEAERANHPHIGTEHLLAGMLREEGCFAADLLLEAGLSLEGMRRQVKAASPQAGAQPITIDMRHERSHIGHVDGCLEILWASTRVAISALTKNLHIPRVGDELIINDPDLGLRSFRVKDVTFYYDTDPPSPGAPQKLTRVIVRVETSVNPGESRNYDST